MKHFNFLQSTTSIKLICYKVLVFYADAKDTKKTAPKKRRTTKKVKKNKNIFIVNFKIMFNCSSLISDCCFYKLKLI